MIPMVPGGERLERFNTLLKLFPKMAKNTKAAMTAYFVKGYTAELIYLEFGIDQPNLSRAVKSMNERNHIVEEIKTIDLYHLTDMDSRNQEKMGNLAS